jgi:hypothetical protein
MKSLIASTAHTRPDPDLCADAVAPAAEALAWVGIGTQLGRGGGRLAESWQEALAAGQMGGGPRRAVLRSAGSRGPLAGALVAPLS